ncbi:MAG: acyltransferase family protein [Saccharofermentans sp.]|nr:acyltransferase family protein [Saccharofermentans sp.]
MCSKNQQVINKKQKNVFVEYLRFIFAVTIVFHHMIALNGIDKNTFILKNGNLAVEFFAVLSGFLMASSISVITSKQLGNTIHYSFKFMYRKWSKLLVMNVVSFLLVFVARQFVMPWEGVMKLFKRLTDNLSEMLLLSTTGIKGVTMNYNGADWYLSAMFISMLVIVPLFFWKPNLFKYYCFPTGILLLGFLMKLNGSIIATEADWHGVLCLGNLRIMGELLLGCAVYYAYVKCDCISEKIKKILRIPTIVGWIVFLYFCHRGVTKETTPAIVIFTCIILWFSFISFNSWNPPKFVRKIGEALGYFSLPLYLNHRGWVFVIKNMNLDVSPVSQVVLVFGISIISALLVTLICRYLLPALVTRIKASFKPETA